MASRRPGSSTWLFWTFVAGLVLRLGALWQTSDLGLHIADERQYAQLATSLLEGRGYAWDTGTATSLRPPAYPAFLAAIWSVTGPGDLQSVRVVQLVLSLLTAVALYQLGCRVSGERVAALAAGIVWLYPPLAYVSYTILTETLFTLVLTLFSLACVALVQRPRVATAALCGLSLGVGALTRSVLWPLPVVLLPLLILTIPAPLGRRVALAGVVLAGYLVVVAPWAVRNTRLQGVPTIVDTMGGMNLRMGNYEHTPEDRMWDAVSMTGERSWVYALSREGHPAGDAITEGQKDKWAQRKAIAYMAAHPVTTLRRSAIKFSDFWGIDRSYVAAVQQGLYQPPGWLAAALAAAMALASAILMIAAGAGMFIARPPWRLHLLLLLPIVAVTAVHTIVFGHPRYHLPLVPILAVYAGALVNRGPLVAWRVSRTARYGAVALPAILAAGWVRQIVIVDGHRIRAFLDQL